METKIKFKGITPKVKEDEETFITKFEAISDSWEDALEVKKVIETKLTNLINGQTTLE